MDDFDPLNQLGQLDPLTRLRLRCALARGASDRCRLERNAWGEVYWQGVALALERKEAADGEDGR